MSDYLVNDVIGRKIDATMYSDVLIKLWLMKETFAKVFAIMFNELHLQLFSELENIYLVILLFICI